MRPIRKRRTEKRQQPSQTEAVKTNQRGELVGIHRPLRYSGFFVHEGNVHFITNRYKQVSIRDIATHIGISSERVNSIARLSHTSLPLFVKALYRSMLRLKVHNPSLRLTAALDISASGAARILRDSGLKPEKRSRRNSEGQ
jgi:hypothetical protein